ncbi:HupE/UreJ family protein [Thalassolituus sp.]|jgi:hypothetical protein|uniref:HupE/UreJ family protein n=1 Tax=Thalassolituus sp. TaxID=2030822 RepID=UPI002A84046C|nr:HupE/UreJ family protein [Thalassolituus sp.]
MFILRFFLLSVLSASSVHAHQASTAFLTGKIGDDSILQVDLQLRLFDLERAIGIDSNHNGQVTWGELLQHKNEIVIYLKRHFSVEQNKQNCIVNIPSNWSIDSHYGEAYLSVPLNVICQNPELFSIYYSAFMDFDSQHKLLINLNYDGQLVSKILANEPRFVVVNPASNSSLSTMVTFIVEGVVHIWKGIDHVLFLLTLLLTSVLVRVDGKWLPQPSTRSALKQSALLASMFTLAHSITLTATALKWVVLPSYWIELGIAFSVAIAALNNIWPMVRQISLLVFVFGLLHGMGFASVLAELLSDGEALPVLIVIAFNIGVELGQLVIVLLALPVLLVLRGRTWYPRWIMSTSSLGIAATACFWIIARS